MTTVLGLSGKAFFVPPIKLVAQKRLALQRLGSWVWGTRLLLGGEGDKVWQMAGSQEADR